MMPPAPFASGGLAPALEGCLEACRRCERLIAAVASAPASDSDPAMLAIGPHLRHCMDHFTCLLRGLESGVLDYDARDREERLERNAQAALERLGEIAARVGEIRAERLGESIEVRQEAAPGGRALVMRSNVQRELVFVSSHTIHHIAIMSLLAQAHGVRVPADLGVAFSTATHLASGVAEANG